MVCVEGECVEGGDECMVCGVFVEGVCMWFPGSGTPLTLPGPMRTAMGGSGGWVRSRNWKMRCDPSLYTPRSGNHLLQWKAPSSVPIPNT